MKTLAITITLLVLLAPVGAQEWTDSADAYKAKALVENAGSIPMAGYIVKLGDWPELIKDSDRHTQWGHAKMPPGSLGRIIPGPANLKAPAARETKSTFVRTVAYDLGGGKGCTFRFSRFSPATWMGSHAESFTALSIKDGAPRFAAYPTSEGIAYLELGKGEPLDGAKLAEPWMLVWRGVESPFQNCFVPSFLHATPNAMDREDYNKYVKPRPADAPVLIVFQHRPASVSLSAEGVRAEFDGPAGVTAFLPIGGFRWYRGSDTRQWAGNLPDAVGRQCRTWSRVLRRIPTGMSEQYAVVDDEVRIRTAFEFEAIANDWPTEPLAMAPISPVTGLALRSGLKNLSIAGGEVVDLDYPTLTGALMGVQGADGYTVTFSGWRKYAAMPDRPGTRTPDARVQGKLDRHLAEMLDAGRLAPYESMQGTMQYSFWGNPSELVEALLAARAHVNADLQERIDEYLHTEIARSGLLDVGWESPREGTRREPHPVDLDMPDILRHRRQAAEPARIENLFGLWLYSRQYDDWAWADSRWADVAKLAHQRDDIIDWELGFHWGGVADLNMRIKGLLGYRQLAVHRQDAAAMNESAYMLVQALINRFAMAKLSEYTFVSNQYIVPDGFDLPRFHARNAHKFNIFLPAYKKGANYRTAPQVGYVSATNRYLSEIGNFWHDHSMWIFANLTPPLAEFLRDTTWPELQNYLTCIDESLPTWYVTQAENLHAIGEDAYFSPYMSWPIFQARALVYREPGKSLARYVDIPVGIGDLYFIEDLVTVLEAD